MDTERIFQSLLHATREAYEGSAKMLGFARFPDDVMRQRVTPYRSHCGDMFRKDKKELAKYPDLKDAIGAASDLVHWREPYKDTNIGQDFRDRFACFCIIGDDAPFWSDAIRLYLIYMPPRLYYPWHHHPAEEMYLVVGGNAEFRRFDLPDVTLSEGGTSFHKSNQPHAMETLDDPVMCLVAWRDDFETPPVWTDMQSFRP